MHAKYDAYMSYILKVMAKGNVLDMRVKGHGQGHLVNFFWHDRKGLTTRNVHVK